MGSMISGLPDKATQFRKSTRDFGKKTCKWKFRSNKSLPKTLNHICLEIVFLSLFLLAGQDCMLHWRVIKETILLRKSHKASMKQWLGIDSLSQVHPKPVICLAMAKSPTPCACFAGWGASATMWHLAQRASLTPRTQLNRCSQHMPGPSFCLQRFS